MLQRGQEPPKRENGKAAPANRLETLPAWSTRSMKNGTPRELGRDRVVSRWQTCSKLAPKRGRHQLDVVGRALGGLVEGLVGHQDRGGEVVGQRHLQQPAGRQVRRCGALDRGGDRASCSSVAPADRRRRSAARRRRASRRASGAGDGCRSGAGNRAAPRGGTTRHLRYRGGRPAAATAAAAKSLPAGAQLGAERLAGLVEFGEVVALRLDDSRAPSRTASIQRRLRRRPTVRACQSGAAAAVGIGAIEPHDRFGGAGRVLGHLGDLVARDRRGRGTAGRRTPPAGRPRRRRPGRR